VKNEEWDRIIISPQKLFISKIGVIFYLNEKKTFKWDCILLKAMTVFPSNTTYR
jgi:hypothetical protein